MTRNLLKTVIVTALGLLLTAEVRANCTLTLTGPTNVYIGEVATYIATVSGCGGASTYTWTNATESVPGQATNIWWTASTNIVSVRVSNPCCGHWLAPGDTVYITNVVSLHCYTAIDAMLVADRSVSMTNNLETGLTKFQGAQLAYSNFVQNLSLTNDQGGLIPFGDTNTLDQTLTNSLLVVLQKIGAIASPSGLSFMSNAIVKAQFELKSSRHHTNALPVIVFLADGDPSDAGGTNDVIAAANYAKTNGTRLITVALGLGSNTNLMRTLASFTNYSYYATNSSQLTQVFSSIGASLCRNGPPLDTDGDGIPDYLEDVNGNGIVDSGETDWRSATDLGFKLLITRPRNGAILLP